MWVTRSGMKTGDNCCPSPGARGGARAAGAVESGLRYGGVP